MRKHPDGQVASASTQANRYLAFASTLVAVRPHSLSPGSPSALNMLAGAEGCQGSRATPEDLGKTQQTPALECDAVHAVQAMAGWKGAHL
mmetsp:Transcript_10261/g.21413  ORF Transcript_10261/g.21413 Transcript_10261/m.21413 type:complete len:90 (-) Transcript_10261:124-393(-)